MSPGAVDHRDLHPVSELREGDERALAEAVVRRDQKQDSTGYGSLSHAPVDAARNALIPVRSRTDPARGRHDHARGQALWPGLGAVLGDPMIAPMWRVRLPSAAR